MLSITRALDKSAKTSCRSSIDVSPLVHWLSFGLFGRHIGRRTKDARLSLFCSNGRRVFRIQYRRATPLREAKIQDFHCTKSQLGEVMRLIRSLQTHNAAKPPPFEAMPSKLKIEW